jgi:peptidyl-prolyl cis-trans isomerase B (cyclophilin B)
MAVVRFTLFCAVLISFSMFSVDAFAGNPKVKLDTSMGEIIIELDAENAKKTTENFLSYVGDKFYDGTIFHRVIDGFMIQGGGFNKKMTQKKTKKPIKNEASKKLKNKRGTIAMARTGDPHSATAQFFINLVDNENLDHTSKTSAGYGYAVFGKVTKGMDVVDKIAKVKTGNVSYFQNVPKKQVIIKSVRKMQ